MGSPTDIDEIVLEDVNMTKFIPESKPQILVFQPH